MSTTHTIMQELRQQIFNNATFAYRGAYTDFVVVTGSGPSIPVSDVKNQSLEASGLYESALNETPNKAASSGPSSSPSLYNNFCRVSDLDFANGIHTDTASTCNDSSTCVTETTVASTWAALIARTGQCSQNIGKDKEQSLLKSPACRSELEAVESLHELLKSEVGKRMSLLTENGISLDTAASSAEVLLRIPPGFAVKVDEESGMLYIVDHANKTTQWQLPGYKSIRTVKQAIPKVQALREAAEEATCIPPSIVAVSEAQANNASVSQSTKGVKED